MLKRQRIISSRVIAILATAVLMLALLQAFPLGNPPSVARAAGTIPTGLQDYERWFGSQHAHVAMDVVSHLTTQYEKTGWEDVGRFRESPEGLATFRFLSEYSKPVPLDPDIARAKELGELSQLTAKLVKRTVDKQKGTIEVVLRYDPTRLAVALLAGRLRGTIFNFEFVRAGRPMSGRFYFLKSGDSTVFVLRFTGYRDNLRSIRNQTDSIARTFVLTATKP